MPAPASFGRPVDGRIPALSLRQPWAWAILHAGKRIENRTAWHSCAHRGEVILHASAWPAGDPDRLAEGRSRPARDFEIEAQTMMVMAERSGREFDAPVTMRDLLHYRGGVVGCARVVDVISGPLDFATAVGRGLVTPEQSAWYMGGFALVLEDVRPLPFVPAKGALGLFGLDDETYRIVMQAKGA